MSQPSASKRSVLAVIGGGINGAAIAREAALRGIDSVLLEGGDLGEGTSSRSSKLVHGGIRYLEQGRIPLVMESLRERAALLRMAPHLVRPARFLVPVYRGDSRGLLRIRTGILLYRLLAGAEGAKLGDHGVLSREEAMRAEPGLRPDGLEGAGTFPDAVMDDARLVLAVARDAARRGASIRTYTEVSGIERRTSGGFLVRGRDRRSGTDIVIEAERVVNATGPWADRTRALFAGSPSSYLRPTRGSHVVLPNLTMGHALLLTARSDRRAFFVIPFVGHTLIGTTDIDDSSSPHRVRATPEEVRYLLRETARALPGAELTSARVQAVFSGLRPLRNVASIPASSVTREDWIADEGGFLTVIGGKYTGFRAVARRVLDRAYPDRRSLGLDPEVRRKRDANLPGAPSGDFGRYVDIRGKEIAAKHGTSPERARAILARFGTDGERILSSDGAEPSAIGPYEELGTDPPLLLAELAHMVQNEFVHTIADVVRRRTALWMGVDFGRPAARIVGEALVRHHGFDRGRIDSEIEAWERQAEDEERLLAEVS